MADIKPLKIYGGVLGPNPSKVMIVLCALNIPYELINIMFKDVKGEEYVKLNPNGRLPTLEDPNTSMKIWESGAIIEYVIDKYDTDFKLSFKPGTEEYYLCKQWLHFQMSGQGPYFGQAV
jgi:glutathione S-transferase